MSTPPYPFLQTGLEKSLPTITMPVSISRTDVVSWYCAVGLLGLILIGSIRESSLADDGRMLGGTNLTKGRPCDEIYVVGDGETLHTISDKCGDPFIVERNPHIHDPDDVFPGLVIKIISSHNPNPTKLGFLETA